MRGGPRHVDRTAVVGESNWKVVGDDGGSGGGSVGGERGGGEDVQR